MTTEPPCPATVRSSRFQLLNCLKPSQAMANVLAEWLSKHDIKQEHIAGQSYAISVLCRAYLFSCI
jgi:bisphosphoglycerate-independent phosphoglycerate mutase (AlkP superfamily)